MFICVVIISVYITGQVCHPVNTCTKHCNCTIVAIIVLLLPHSYVASYGYVVIILYDTIKLLFVEILQATHSEYCFTYCSGIMEWEDNSNTVVAVIQDHDYRQINYAVFVNINGPTNPKWLQCCLQVTVIGL